MLAEVLLHCVKLVTLTNPCLQCINQWHFYFNMLVSTFYSFSLFCFSITKFHFHLKIFIFLRKTFDKDKFYNLYTIDFVIITINVAKSHQLFPQKISPCIFNWVLNAPLAHTRLEHSRKRYSFWESYRVKFWYKWHALYIIVTSIKQPVLQITVWMTAVSL